MKVASWARWERVWQRAWRVAPTRRWRRLWTRQMVRWARLSLTVAALFWIVAAHLYLADQAVVLWHDIRTMQYESWQMWWEITTWQTELAARRNAQAMRQALTEQQLVWPEPAGVLYVPVVLPAAAQPVTTEAMPGVWAPPPTPEAWLPAEYTRSLSQWWRQGGWEAILQRWGWPVATTDLTGPNPRRAAP